MKTALLLLTAFSLAASSDPAATMRDRTLTVAQRNDACFTLRGQSSPEIVQLMRRELNDAKLRACAGENLRVAQAVDALKSTLADDDPEVRAIAARELGSFHKPELLETLARMTRDPQLLVASNAMEALSSYPIAQARPYLEELARNGSLIGQMAINCLAQASDPQAAPIARHMLASGDIGDMLAGMHVLGQLGDESDLPALTKIAEKDTEQMSSKGRGFGLMPAISLSRAARTAIARIRMRAAADAH